MKSLQRNLTNENKKPEVPKLDIHSSLIEFTQDPELVWLADFIWHHQQFERFRNEDYQKWQIENFPGTMPYQKKILITCYNGNTPPSKNTDLALASVVIENFSFPFKQLTLFYQNGRCSFMTNPCDEQIRASKGS